MMFGLVAVIVLSVLTGMSHMMMMLLSLLCITVSGSCSYRLSVISISWSLQMLQWRYAAALLCVEMYSVLANTTHPDTIWSTVYSCWEHILHQSLLAGHILFPGSFWCLLLGLELLPVAPLFILGFEHVFKGSSIFWSWFIFSVLKLWHSYLVIEFLALDRSCSNACFGYCPSLCFR